MSIWPHDLDLWPLDLKVAPSVTATIGTCTPSVNWKESTRQSACSSAEQRTYSTGCGTDRGMCSLVMMKNPEKWSTGSTKESGSPPKSNRSFLRPEEFIKMHLYPADRLMHRKDDYITEFLSPAVFEIMAQTFWVTTLTSQGHVTSSITWPIDLSQAIFPISCPMALSLYLSTFLRYLHLNISESQPWPFRVTRRYRSSNRLKHHMPFPIGALLELSLYLQPFSR